MEPETTITIERHRPSGERYAAERQDEAILRVAGPIYHDDPTDPETLADLLADAPGAEEDAEWWEAYEDRRDQW